uniref:IS110 family transposase n=1 Tax=Eisenbergiella tayi TaxID=1432052 RepID=UPI003FEFB7BC
MNLNAVGIDVFMRNSTVAILRPGGNVMANPFGVSHPSSSFLSLIHQIRDLNDETRIVMECTGRYDEPVACRLSQAGFLPVLLIHKLFVTFKVRKILSAE